MCAAVPGGPPLGRQSAAPRAASLPAGADEVTAPEDAVALCLSGGGYRAMLFHVGALWRLDELGWLPRLARVSSVSGGSITAGVPAMTWGQLVFDSTGVATHDSFPFAVVDPVREMARQHVIEREVTRGTLPYPERPLA